MWKIVSASVMGTSHREGEIPCQDASAVEVVGEGERSALVLVAADGAGSASHSDEGSEIACEELIRQIEAAAIADDWLEHATHETVQDWLAQVREAITLRAAELEVEPRQMATTVVAAIVAQDLALFFQIGDGAAVYWDMGQYYWATWPQSGEYANSTFFLTDETFATSIQVHRIEHRVDECALFTDGLERLILRFSDQTVHTPFLEPMFTTMRASDSVDHLHEPLEQFLNSPAINERTNDDKTLILATRLTADDAVG